MEAAIPKLGPKSHASSPLLVLAALIFGLATGLALKTLAPSPAQAFTVEAFDVVGTLWVSAIRMTVIPLIMSILIAAIVGARNGGTVGRLGLAAGGLFFGLLVVFAGAAALTAPALFSGLHIDPTATAALRAQASATALPTGDGSIAGWLKALVPTNPVKAAADGAMLPLVVFTLALGFTAAASPVLIRERVSLFVETLSALMLQMIQAIIAAAPIGVFALTVVVGAKLGGAAFGALGYYVLVGSGAHFAGAVLLCGIGMLGGGMSPRKFFAGAGEALAIAMGTSSSLSALPAMIEGARDRWRLRETISGFVLPLAASTFKLTAANGWVFNATFVAMLYGIHLSGEQIALLVGYTVLMNPTIPGIPGGGIIAISPMFITLGLPVEGLAILLAVNPIVDRFSTLGNISADMAVAAILDRRMPAA